MEVLDNEVKEKANTVKVKDAACMKFKKEKEELEKSFHKVLKEQTARTEFECDLCDICVGSGVKLGQHIKSNHYKEQQCQTSESESERVSLFLLWIHD